MKNGKLLFFDDFSGKRLDTMKWERCPEQPRQGNAAFWKDHLSFLDGKGHLVLRAEWDQEEKIVKSGAVRTLGLFEAGYGYYEALIRFPVAKGIWGAFWLMCGDVQRVTGNAADGVEIDIVESINNEMGAYNFALHYDGYGVDLKSVKSGLRYDADIYDGKFHLFALDRTENHYAFYIDGKEQWRVSSDECAACPCNGYIKLTVEAADWAGVGSDESIRSLPAEMLVSCVKVYDHNPNL